MTDDELNSLSLDTARLRDELRELDGLSRSFGASLSRAFASALVDGRKLSDVLRGLALSLSRQALSAALKPALGSLTPFADGGAADGLPQARAGSPVSLTVNIATPDVPGFQRAQGQIAAGLIRAIERGNRNL